ncbi:ComEA family DNA-binding protein [Leifsonia sp. AG29]|uniref:ComEA family DNA-binding protein n=1 Tax=Leifsonia sp. AG29 TaxID=2598860 RepID=UPI00131BD9E9|nr:helix-hairpin-helix domain-containing protein [Leifsonia sp. AG29]
MHHRPTAHEREGAGDDPPLVVTAEPADDALAPAPRPARVRLGVGAVVVLLVTALVIAVAISALSQSGSSSPLPIPTARSSTAPPGVAAAAGPLVLVHVLGGVRTPGLVSLRSGARVVDAVAAAGGLTDDADPGGVNLARTVSDGEQLYVPRVGEQAPSGSVAGASADGSGSAGSGGPPSAKGGGKIDLNRATAGELEALPRIGPALAQRIVDWREANGRFASVSDLQKVTGIGDKIFAGLKDLVTV